METKQLGDQVKSGPLPAEGEVAENSGADGPLVAPAVPPAGKADAATETELKLLADPQQLADFANAPIVTRYANNRGVVRHLIATYFDTSGLALRDAGFVVRVRRSGRQFTMTVKSDAVIGANMLSRGEWEKLLPDDQIDRDWLMSLLPQKLAQALADQPLLPVFTTQVRRHVRLLTLPTGTVEMAIDRGHVVAGDQSAEISEIELELKQGNAAMLFQMARELSQTGTLRPSTDAKSTRGYELFLRSPPDVRKPPKPAFAANERLDDVFSMMLRATLHHLLDNQAAAEDGRHVEGVHQLRVALRRLRAALTLMRGIAPSPLLESLRADAKWLASAMGNARNLDVLITQTLPEIEKACFEVKGFAGLHQICEARRADAYDTVRTTLRDARTGRFLIELGLWIEQRGWRADVSSEVLSVLVAPARDFAETVLTRRHRKIVKRGRKFEKMPPHERHELRLALKKLRYSVDFFLPVFGNGKKIARYTQLLAAIQDRLGHYNDGVTTAHLMTEIRPQMEAPDEYVAMGAVLGWSAAERHHVEDGLAQVWTDFRSARLPWK